MPIVVDAAPSEIRLADHGRALRIVWEDGAVSGLPAGLLRSKSRSAGAVRNAIENGAAETPSAVVIEAVEPVGSYALRLFFSDGHDRGIYPWRYLRELAAA